MILCLHKIEDRSEEIACLNTVCEIKSTKNLDFASILHKLHNVLVGDTAIENDTITRVVVVLGNVSEVITIFHRKYKWQILVLKV